MDYAATTPMDNGVEKAMRPFYAGVFGNPSSSHLHGQAASRAVFLARQGIAKALNADYKELIFTGSATEANNLAIRGVFEYALGKVKCVNTPLRIVVSQIEHESVYEACMALKRLHAIEIIEIPVNGEGIVNLLKLKEALNENTIVVSVQMANSEVGVIQPIKEIADVIKKFREAGTYPLLHTDGVQAFQYMKCDVADWGVDMMTLSAHKIYGPKGIGLLYVKKGIGLEPQVAGGGQENGMRSGTENVPAIVGFGKAIEITEKLRAKESKRVAVLRDALWKGIKKILPDAELNGSIDKRLPNNLSVYLPSRPAQDVCIELDLMGIAVSPGTACASRAAEPSRVIKALGFSGDRPLSSIRFSLGRLSTMGEIRSVLSILKKRFGK
jgi:cysteine desulfurase